MPFEGHVNPLTELAVYLDELGYDVRWYVGGSYGKKIERLGLFHYPFRQARLVNQANIDRLFPERTRLRGSVARLRFDINNVFLLRVPEFVADLTEIHQHWAFDLLVCDVMFVAAPFVQELLKVKTAVVGVIPLGETDPNLPPSGLGLLPATRLLGQWQHGLLRWFTQRMLFRPCHRLYNQLRQQHGLAPVNTFVFDAVIRSADLYLQSGVPDFEYPRRNISPNIRFIGPLLPYQTEPVRPLPFAGKLNHYATVLLVTQGTVEQDPEKLLVPTLNAFRATDTLVVVTTGGTQTAELRARYPQENIIIEDFIDFNAIMPYADVFVTNAGYGGVMLSITHELPLVTAGIHEGKNEIAARVGYFKLGINLNTETPTADQIRGAVERVLSNPQYKRNVGQLSWEFSKYNPNQLIEGYVRQLLGDEMPEDTNLNETPLNPKQDQAVLREFSGDPAKPS